MRQPTCSPTEPSVAYHGTHASFDRFSLDYAARPGMCDNGHLGVWLAVDQALAQSFGARCLTVQLNVGCAYTMPFSELIALHRQCLHECSRLASDEEAREYARRFYAGQRQRLLSEGYDTVFILENSGTIDLAVGLAPERLEILSCAIVSN